MKSVTFDIYHHIDLCDAISIQLIVDTIGDALQTLDKNWVLVFDRINALFAKSVNQNAKDVQSLM